MQNIENKIDKAGEHSPAFPLPALISTLASGGKLIGTLGVSFVFLYNDFVLFGL